ncbi:PIN domain-like protein, partial [Tribonema minus]
MGISGLLQTLKSITHPVHVRDLEGLTVGVDAYCWLHRGAYSCSTEICRGEFTDKFVRFCMRRIELLLSHGVTPWVVFDGAPLPMKHGVNKARRDARAANLAKAEAAMAAGEPIAAQQHYARSVAITHELARMFIRSLARRGIKFVVAPYEADAQLAFMSQQGLIDAIITEDSDCLPFCCKRMLFKLENDGSAQEIRARDLSSNENPSLAGWTYSMFLDMCLLAGCDYLPRVHGLGIGTAHKLVARHRSHKPMLAALRASRKFALPDDFEDRFEMARLTFRHQRVYDPRSRCVVPLMPLPPSARERQNLDFLGPELPPHIAEAIANSTMDPYTREPY